MSKQAAMDSPSDLSQTHDDLVGIKAGQAFFDLRCESLAAVTSKKITWLWKNRIPKGTLTIIEGDGGRGKSTLIADLCSRLSLGEKLEDDDTIREPQNILLLSAEDDPSCVLRPRFEAHGADLERVMFDDQAMLLNQQGVLALERAIIRHHINVVVIDPIVAFLGPKVDMNKGNDVRSVLGPIMKIGHDTGCSFIIVRHFNKNREGSAAQRGAGSVDFRNAARSVLQVLYTEECSYLALEKSNYAANAKTLTFQIEDSRVKWGMPTDLSADQLHATSMQFTEERSALYEAIEFLSVELRYGPRPAKDILRGASDAGIADKTLRRAKDRLKVRSQKANVGWMWEITTTASSSKIQGGQAGQHLLIGDDGRLDHLGSADS